MNYLLYNVYMNGRFEKGCIPWNKAITIDRNKYPTLGHFKPHTDESKKLMSDKLKGRKGTMKDKKFSDLHRKNLSISHTGYVMPESQRTKISIGVRNNTIRLEKVQSQKNRDIHREQMIERLLSGKIGKKVFNTKPERKMKEILNSLGLVEKIDYIHQKRISNYVYDFEIIKHKILIETDGYYYHSKPEIKEHDLIKEEFAKCKQYKIIRFWDYEIYNSKEDVKNKISNLIKE